MLHLAIAKHQSRANYAIWLLNFLFAALVCWGVSGGTPRIHDILLFWAMWNCLWLKPIIFKSCLPLLLIWVMFAPIGVQFGYPNAGMIASLFETTRNEALEFFDFRTVFYFIITIISFALMFYLTKKIQASIKQIKFFKYFSLILVVLFITNMLKFNQPMIKWHYSELLHLIPHTLAHYDYYLINKQRLQELKQLKDDWQIVNYNPNYQNYILVIGESASKDYLSAYGYPINSSPFLKTVNGVQYQNLIAPAAHTIKSIPRLLTIPTRQEVEYQNNIINLANQLNMDTYWISNQDKMGEYENEISYLASYAKHNYYLSEVAPTTARYDYQMLPKLKEVINAPSNHPKLIVVHLMGSHTRFVKRVDFNKAHFDFDDKHLSSYLSSLLQTDMFLEELYQELKNNKQPFSMVYLSDHGLSPMDLKHGISQFSLKVPLFKISSDDNHRQINDDIISGFGFIWFLTEWLGVETSNQTQNTFLKHHRVNDFNDVMIFDDGIKPYLNTESFNGKILLPNAKELQE